MPSTTTFRIGGDLTVGRLGFGAMHLPTERPEDRPSAIAVARRAVELGITLIDTAHMYGGGANEEVLAEALHPYPKDLLITTKVGVVRSAGTGDWSLNGRPESLRAEVDHALRRLRVDRIELLQLHRIDPETPLADQLGALRDLRETGKVGRIGLSEVSAAELAAAREIVDIASVQNRYNLTDREHEPVLAACEAAGIAFLPWRTVAWGKAGDRAEVAAVAAELGVTATQVCLAWLLDHSPVMLPIPGTSSVAHLEENTAAADIALTPEQRARLDGIAGSS
ncbi:oxidoreductase [Streptomyces sp. Root63]|uniref:aldo/keto reductase n=1 Tax=unclassified Streptomyces TaxID=2593676 RepID=UPI0006FA0060|nr:MULTISPECIES: aldo/keto reductase [unclassified Streptomyces]KQX39011.1 oxidoreductase [Streptomyces sp. Root1295]KRA48423.1 oxidoreductase [Streptomyces sp. Root63]